MSTKFTEIASRVANRFLNAMARDRVTFKEAITKHLTGASEHFYRVRLATRTGNMASVPAWEEEVEKLLKAFEKVLRERINGFSDKALAVREAVVSLRQTDANRRRQARGTVEKYHGALREGLTDADENDFWALVKARATAAGLTVDL